MCLISVTKSDHIEDYSGSCDINQMAFFSLWISNLVMIKSFIRNSLPVQMMQRKTFHLTHSHQNSGTSKITHWELMPDSWWHRFQFYLLTYCSLCCCAADFNIAANCQEKNNNPFYLQRKSERRKKNVWEGFPFMRSWFLLRNLCYDNELNIFVFKKKKTIEEKER